MTIPEQKNDSLPENNTSNSGSNSPENQNNVGVEKNKEEADVKQETSKDLKGLLDMVSDTLQKEIEDKLKNDPARAGQLIAKVEKVTKVGIGMQIKSGLNTVGNFFSFIKRFKPDFKEPAALTQLKDKLNPIADQVGDIEEKGSDIMGNMGAQIMGGGAIGSETNPTSKDSLDVAIDKLQLQSKEIKKKEGMTVSIYRAAVLKLLQQVSQEIKSYTPGTTAIVDTKSDSKTDVIQKSAEINEEDEGNEFNDVKVKPDDNLDDLKDTYTSDMITLDKMKSNPFSRSGTGTTECSKTARLNLEYFGIVGAPQANAFDAKDMYGKTFDVGKQIGSGKIVDIKNSFSQDIKGSYFDIFTESKSKFGHRLVGFRSEPSNQIYVMDPYNIKKDGYSSREPMKIENYIKTVCEAKNRPILKIVGYETKKKVVDSSAVIAQAKSENGKVLDINNEKKAAA